MSKQITDINGNTWTESETRLYNQFNWELERTKNSDTREFLLDQRHRFYLFTSECYRLGLRQANEVEQ